MNPEKLMDAMNLLPDELLEETDTVRQKKHFPWKSVSALAACLCLLVGFWLAFPGAKSADGALGSIAENGTGIADKQQFSQGSTAAGYMVATVVEVHEAYITVIPGKQEETGDCILQRVSLKHLQEVPKLIPGEYIRLYLTKGEDSGETETIPTLFPYRIEIEEE